MRVGGRAFTLDEVERALDPAASPIGERSLRPSYCDEDLGRGRHNRAAANNDAAAIGEAANRCEVCNVPIPETRKRGWAFGGRGRPRTLCGDACRKKKSRRKQR